MMVLCARSWWHTSRDPLASNQWLVTPLQILREKRLIIFLHRLRRKAPICNSSPKDHIDRRRGSNV